MGNVEKDYGNQYLTLDKIYKVAFNYIYIYIYDAAV